MPAAACADRVEVTPVVLRVRLIAASAFTQYAIYIWARYFPAKADDENDIRYFRGREEEISNIRARLVVKH